MRKPWKKFEVDNLLAKGSCWNLQSNHGCPIRSHFAQKSCLKSPSSNVCLLSSNLSTIVVSCCIVVFHRILTGLIQKILHQLGLLKTLFSVLNSSDIHHINGFAGFCASTEPFPRQIALSWTLSAYLGPNERPIYVVCVQSVG